MIASKNLGKLDQERITSILSDAQHTISVADAATILGLSKKGAAKILSRLVGKGCLTRIKRGLYVPIQPAADSCLLNDPWLVVEKLYSSCYIGGWSAAVHWGLTTEDFFTTVVLTTQKPRIRNQVINGNHFLLRTISPDALFGLQTIRREKATVLVSDPSRTIIDFMVDPQLGGGIHNVIDIFNKYLMSEHRNIEILFSYAKKILNGAVLKRLGYLLEKCNSGEFNIIGLCKILMNSGYIKLDPMLSGDKLITRWGLWI